MSSSAAGRGGGGYASPTSPRKVVSTTPGAAASSLPPPPRMTIQPQAHSNYAQTIAKSMTIEEMRQLHQRALSEAEAKQTELRLVLASRYRELVGSSEEVTKMRERAQELHELVHALPQLMQTLLEESTAPYPPPTSVGGSEEKADDEAEDVDGDSKVRDKKDIMILRLRHDLSQLPRLIHRALDQHNVHEAAVSLMKLFRVIAQHTDEYPLASALSPSITCEHTKLDDLVQAQIRMTYLHVQTMPVKIQKLSKYVLSHAASYDETSDASADPRMFGAQTSAAALSTLDFLQTSPPTDRTMTLVDLYFDSKAKLLQSLLEQLSGHKRSEDDENETASNAVDTKENDGGAHAAEAILSKIVLILQYDIILHPYQIFCLRKFPCLADSSSTAEVIMETLPQFPATVVRAKASNFLAAHLPLIRSKVKTILVDIAGTTASALGKIRQSLYDKTDGVDCMQQLDNNGLCTWDEAVSSMVDVHSVLSSTSSSPLEASSSFQDRKFSLWGVLFSHTFSSLVHSLLSTSFHSVHTKVASTLRLSLRNAPPLEHLLPHEAYRNTLQIASELDKDLLKVSDDAHELLVHAEEREESERRLKQSLYVQTCEIMGRLICELRRMLTHTQGSASTDSEQSTAVKELIVGRLCHLLKFRLTALPTLLDSNSSPAVIHGTSGMISLLELQSAFDLADDNEDGMITFAEAIEAVDSAFSGTSFHGAELVRETLLLQSTSGNDGKSETKDTMSHLLQHESVTLNELALLSARGLRHEKSGRNSALGIIQSSLDDIVETCFHQWSTVALSSANESLSESIQELVRIASTSSEAEYTRLYSPEESKLSSSTAPVVDNVSPHVVGYLLNVSFELNRSICPSDSLSPVPSQEYAHSIGIVESDVPKMIDTIRWSLLLKGFMSIVAILEEHIAPALDHSSVQIAPSALVQLKNDLGFIESCFGERNKHGFGRTNDEASKVNIQLKRLASKVDGKVGRSYHSSDLEAKRKHAIEVCDLFFSSLFGEDDVSSVPLDVGEASRAPAHPLLHAPLPSSCRFSLLPIQADRALTEAQLRKYKKKEESESSKATSGGAGVVGSGFGFLSSMIKGNR